MSDQNARERAGSPFAGTPARLALPPAIRVSDPGLQRYLDAVRNWLEVRAGALDALEGLVTKRDLVQLGLADASQVQRGFQQRAMVPPSTLPGAGVSVLVQTPAGAFPLSIDAFAKAITDTALFRGLMQRLDDPRRFDDFPHEVRAALAKSIADEAAERGAAIRRLELTLQSEAVSLAQQVTEVTAAVEGASAGVRELSFASASASRAMAGQITQVQARLDAVPVDPASILATVHANLAALESAIPEGVQGKYYQVDDPADTENFLYRWNGTAYELVGRGTSASGTATVEQSLLAIADRNTGLESRYTLKVQAGNKLAGFGIAATENDAGADSAFIIAADKFAIVDPSDTIADPLNPPLARIPFGVDVANNTIYINGNVRINAGGPLLSGLTGTEKTVVVFAYKRSASAPGDNPGDGGVYDFDTKTLSGLANGWSTGIPAANGNPLYVRAATASSTGSSDTITGAEWSGAVLMVQDGDDGAAGSNGTNGLNSATVQLFRRTTTSTAPTLGGASPTNDLTYTFSTGVLSGTPPTSWTTTIPAAANGAYLWTVRATAASTGATDTITVAEWSAVQALAQDGNVGRTVACYTDIGTHAFTLNSNGTGVIESSGIQPRRTLAGFAGTGTTVWSVVSGTFTGATTTLSESDGRMATVTVDEMGTDAVTLRCTYTEGSFSASDDITLYKLKDGVGAYLSNEAHTLPASSAGVVSSYTGATGTFVVLDGGRVVSTTRLTFSVQGYTGFSGGGGISINSSGVYTVASGIQDASDVATVTLRCVYAPVHGASVTIDRLFKITKAKQGTSGSNGSNGTNGANGVRGSLDLYISGTGPLTSAECDSAVLSATGSSTKVLGDTVVESNGSTYISTLRWNGSSWAAPGVVIDGSLLVTGSVTTPKIAANAITADKITSSGTSVGGVAFALGNSTVTVNGIRGAGMFLSDTNAWYAIVAANTSNQTGAGGIAAGVTNGSSYAGTFVNANNSSFTQIRCRVQLAQNQRAGEFINYQGDYTSKDSEVWLCENANAVEIKTGMFRYDRTLETGAGTATFSGTKPGGTQTNEWLRINVSGVDKLIPVWTAA